MAAYLDNNASTKLLPAAAEAMQPYLADSYGNPSSPHRFGQESRRAVEKARSAVAELLGAMSPSEIIFTSCATESINQAFHIAWEIHGTKRLHIVTSSVEHAAVLEASEFYRAKGATLSIIPVNSSGDLDLDRLDSVLAKSPAFVSLILANNETGVIFPVEKAGMICRSHKALFHLDATQGIGKMPASVRDWHCDYLSISAHKFHGPKGAGALFVRAGGPRTSFIKGHQETGARGGTENVPGIVGMGVAAEETHSTLATGVDRMASLRDMLESAILAAVPRSQVNGSTERRLCNTSNIYFPGKHSANLVERLSAQSVYVSAASACATGGKPSHVLRAMGLGEERANASLRFSVGKLTTKDEINYAVRTVPKAIHSSLDVFSVR
jgi:cysteine desulfurase